MQENQTCGYVKHPFLLLLLNDCPPQEVESTPSTAAPLTTRRSCSGTTAAWWPWRPRAPTGTAASSWCAWTSARPSTVTASPSDGLCRDCWYASDCVALVVVHNICSWCPAGVLLLWSSFVGWEGHFEYVAGAVPVQGQCRVVAHGCCPSPASFAHIPSGKVFDRIARDFETDPMRLHAPKRGYAATILDCGVLPASYRPPVMPPPRLTRAALAATPVYGSPEPPSMAGA